jgi:hypothetical protein
MNEKQSINLVIETCTGHNSLYNLDIQDITTYMHLVYKVLSLTTYNLGINAANVINAGIFLRIHVRPERIERLELTDEYYMKALERVLNGPDNTDIFVKLYDEMLEDDSLLNQGIEKFVSLYSDLEYLENRVQLNLVNSIALYKQTDQLWNRYNDYFKEYKQVLKDRSNVPQVIVDRIILLFENGLKRIREKNMLLRSDLSDSNVGFSVLENENILLPGEKDYNNTFIKTVQKLMK